MSLSLYTYRGMPLNKILATNENDHASGITIVDNPLENYFTPFYISNADYFQLFKNSSKSVFSSKFSNKYFG